jgi:CDP-diacylglycerol---glycerol-3-phosphate 3-phosphatidyltransferase
VSDVHEATGAGVGLGGAAGSPAAGADAGPVAAPGTPRSAPGPVSGQGPGPALSATSPVPGPGPGAPRSATSPVPGPGPGAPRSAAGSTPGPGAARSATSPAPGPARSAPGQGPGPALSAPGPALAAAASAVAPGARGGQAVSPSRAAGFGPSALATPANAVTLGRLVVTPLLLLMIVNGGSTWPATGFWVLLSGTDGVDGYLARRHGTTSSGAFLDPLADKFLVLGAMFALVAKGLFWWLPVTLIAVREVGISVYRSYYGRQGLSIPARTWAKVKTVVQDVAVGFALLPLTAGRHWVADVWLWAAVALALVTGAQYLLDGRKAARAV